MGYLFRGFFRESRSFWILILGIVVWTGAGIDFFSGTRARKGLFGGHAIDISLVVLVLGPIVFFMYRGLTKKKRESDRARAKNYAAVFEPEREAEIRAILQVDPHFATMCYECMHFHTELYYCKRKRSKDPRQQRVKEIKINNKVYCLYWEPPDSPLPPEPYPQEAVPQLQPHVQHPDYFPPQPPAFPHQHPQQHMHPPPPDQPPQYYPPVQPGPPVENYPPAGNYPPAENYPPVQGYPPVQPGPPAGNYPPAQDAPPPGYYPQPGGQAPRPQQPPHQPSNQPPPEPLPGQPHYSDF